MWCSLFIICNCIALFKSGMQISIVLKQSSDTHNFFSISNKGVGVGHTTTKPYMPFKFILIGINYIAFPYAQKFIKNSCIQTKLQNCFVRTKHSHL